MTSPPRDGRLTAREDIPVGGAATAGTGSAPVPPTGGTTRPPSRRNLVKGVAWSVPVIMAAAPTPAYAASNTAQFGVIFDGPGGANGYLQASYLDLGLDPGSPLSSYRLIDDLVVTFTVVGLSGPAANERDLTVGTSYGTVTRSPYDSATRTTTCVWVIPAGTVIPKVSTATNVPDVLFSWRDGATGRGRVTNKIVVTGVRNGYITYPSAPPIDSTVVKENFDGRGDGIY